MSALWFSGIPTARSLLLQRRAFLLCTASSYPGHGLSSRCLPVLPPDTAVWAHDCGFASEHPFPSESAHAVVRIGKGCGCAGRRFQLSNDLKILSLEVLSCVPCLFLFLMQGLQIAATSVSLESAQTQGMHFSEPLVQLFVHVMLINTLSHFWENMEFYAHQAWLLWHWNSSAESSFRIWASMFISKMEFISFVFAKD